MTLPGQCPAGLGRSWAEAPVYAVQIAKVFTPIKALPSRVKLLHLRRDRYGSGLTMMLRETKTANRPG